MVEYVKYMLESKITNLEKDLETEGYNLKNTQNRIWSLESKLDQLKSVISLIEGERDPAGVLTAPEQVVEEE